MYSGKLVLLRALEISDLDFIMNYYNDWNLRRWTGVPIPKSRHLMKQWLEKAVTANAWKDGQLYFALCEKESSEFLGIARFYDIKLPHQRASMGISIYKVEQRMKGYGTDATILMLWIAFHVLGLHSVYLDTMEDNERAIRVAEKTGFKRIGVFRETEYIDGQFKGLLFMDILRDEFMEKYPNGSMFKHK